MLWYGGNTEPGQGKTEVMRGGRRQNGEAREHFSDYRWGYMSDTAKQVDCCMEDTMAQERKMTLVLQAALWTPTARSWSLNGWGFSGTDKAPLRRENRLEGTAIHRQTLCKVCTTFTSSLMYHYQCIKRGWWQCPW